MRRLIFGRSTISAGSSASSLEVQLPKSSFDSREVGQGLAEAERKRNAQALADLNLSKEVFEALLTGVRRRLTPQACKLRGRVEVRPNFLRDTSVDSCISRNTTFALCTVCSALH